MGLWRMFVDPLSADEVSMITWGVCGSEGMGPRLDRAVNTDWLAQFLD